jgi:hypothetical protein
MKKLIITAVLSILLIVSMNAQKLNLPDGNAKKGSFKYSYLQLDVNFLNYPIRNVNTNGLSVNGAAVFGDRLATGLSIDITDSRKLFFAQVGIIEPNTFEYSQVSFYNEVFFHPNSRIDISLPIKLGVGHATVNPQDKFLFGETLFSNKDVLAGDYFFVSELGVNVSVHLIRTMDFNIGGSYRLTSGANGIVVDDDFFNYSVHAGLRFRIAGKK